MSKTAIVLIFAHKEKLEWYEVIALRQCFNVLGRHPIKLACPSGLNIEAYVKIVPELEADFFPAEWFSSRLNYNRLKILPFLYHRYSQYEYMLTYELDAFVFRDELLDWCAKGWDFIGAPWFEGFDSANQEARLLGVGNSGFSLRRIQAMIEVFSTWRIVRPPMDIVREVQLSDRSSIRKLAATIKKLTFNNFHSPFLPANDDESHPARIHDDCFWCLEVPKKFPKFRVSNLEDAIGFSFEVNPSRLFADRGKQLPFGCHKWMNYEYESFWKPMIEPFGYELR